jgi:hypothetical protein
MALRQTIKSEGKSIVHTPYGIVENGTQSISFSAYIKVSNIRGDKSQLIATVNFTNELQQFTKEYLVPISVATGSSNFIAQIYEHLKTLPEFAGAIDC